MGTGFSIFNIFTLLGGLAFFLYGMNVMSTGLEKLTGGKLEVALKKMTSNKFKSILLGMGITIAIQSSSAMTVMLVGLVNSGIMQLEQTVGVLFGSDVGTTLTAWLLSLAGVEDGGSVWLKMLKPTSFAPLVALIGTIFIMMSKQNKKKDIGCILVGFAVLMTGMTFMSDSVKPLAESEEFQSILTAFKNPFLGVLVGAGFTGVVQSSAASIGILQSFSQTGVLTYGMALPIVMGLNIGTCVTALISSIGVKKSAKRVACIHIAVKIIGVIILLPVVLILQQIFNFAIWDKPVGYVGIAVMHTLFNLIITIILLPFSDKLVKLAYMIVRDSENDKEDEVVKTLKGLDEILLKTPAVAVNTCYGATCEMADLTKETIASALSNLIDYDKEVSDQIVENEDVIDGYEDTANNYLMKISKSSISENDSHIVARMMHCVGNFERISDHAVNLVESAQEMHDKGIKFSDECVEEIRIISDAITENISKAFEAYVKHDYELAHKVEPLEEVVDNLSTELKNRHIRRLQNGECTVELGYIFQDILTNLERISDHCSNIAGCIIETTGEKNLHEYRHDVKENDETFRSEYREYAELYFGRLGDPAKK